MVGDAHTYGPTCRLAPVPQPDPLAEFEGIPPLNAQFFYSSPIPIDDPLSAASFVGSAESKAAKYPLRPFSAGDNNALEKAWFGFASDGDRRNHGAARTSRSPSPSLSRLNAEKLAAIVDDLVMKHQEMHERESQPQSAALRVGSQLPEAGGRVCCSELLIDASAELRKAFCALTRRRLRVLDQDKLIRSVMSRLQRPAPITAPLSTVARQKPPSVSPSNASPPLPLDPVPQLGEREEERIAAGSEDEPQTGSDRRSAAPALPPDLVGGTIPVRPPAAEDGISGRPFVRVETEAASSGRSTPASSARHYAPAGGGTPADPSVSSTHAKAADDLGTKPSNRAQSLSRDVKMSPRDSVEIPVGISKLHMVSLPILQMKPIYWSPVNDIAIVLRATWFYRDTMVPVEPVVANQLEAGYREMKPYGETWRDELRCALQVGALAEEKLSHPLWADQAQHRRKDAAGGGPADPLISTDPFCAARCFRGEAAAEGTLELVQSRTTSDSKPPETRSYLNHHVIYKDASTAFLLKPSLRPSAYYGRKPVSRIVRGMTVGVPVVRGFDRQAWDKLHTKETPPTETQKVDNTEAFDGDEESATRPCQGCLAETERDQVTDLVLVAHGIGQKFAERVESFHFTHAINAFRRAVNIELATPAVRSVLREGSNKIMVLPVNWRHNLSFEDGGPMTEEDRSISTPDGFTLKDIEPDTIPAVRSMISDVMFDIPFYMSHHKPKMIAALVREANRVYRLWCRNNPSFAGKGRVHLIGHSLGTAMALEVLSRQPTRLPPVELGMPMETTRFEFDTTNLFLLGSPAGFFLLLERGRLLPRRGRLKPGADPSDTVARDVVGEERTFGCLAVDNIYNILAREDPIAYFLNGTIDPAYASSLKTAHVPSTATSFLTSVGNTVRGWAGVPAAPAELPSAAPVKPPTVRLPSQLEMEVHDFTREEVAEKKAYLLNDNGQIDYYLRSGGGPLEIQYLNMLSAHTSYWTNNDLIRMLCIEIGRRPGRQNTLPSMRAVKVTRRLPPGSVTLGRSS